MSPSRRSVLGSAAGLASLAGCNAFSSTPNTPADGAPGAGSLAGETLFLADGLAISETDADRTDDPTAASLAVYGADETARVADTLSDDTPAAVVGRGAPGTILRACDRLDARYGFCSRGWTPETRIAAAVPRDARLDTHVFVGARLPEEIPWALAETLDPPSRQCSVPLDAVSVPDSTVPAGTARVRGRNDAGGFDRRDSVAYSRDGDETAVYVDTSATIRSGRAADADGRYRADRVILAADFEAELAAVGPGARSTDGLRVRNQTDPTENAVRQAFTAASDATRETFTACSRCRVVPDEVGETFGYTANARFRWRDSRLLRSDDTWLQHTPGGAFWSL